MNNVYRDLLKKIEICFVLQGSELIQTRLAEKIRDTDSKNWVTHKLLNELHRENLVDAPNVNQGSRRYCALTERGREFVKGILEVARKVSHRDDINHIQKRLCSDIPTNIQIGRSKMNKKHFKNWLRSKGYNKRTINSRISNCERVERCEGDLNNHFDRDKLKNLIESLEYSAQDQKLGHQQKHKIPINGNICNGTATLKQAVKLYREFRVSENHGQIINMHKQTAKKKKSKNRTVEKWPEWKQPDEKVLLKLAEEVAPFVRFLNPKIIREITEDNRKHQDEWSEKLRECGVDPNIYLWDSSPCAFPGIRRGINSERVQQRLDKPFADCLYLDPDGNTFPKHLWAFVFTDCEFRKLGPKGYQLAHIFDHKTYKKGLYEDRWKEEVEGWKDPENNPKLFGLFTSPANTVYVPTVFLKPTDHNPRLRTLLQRKAFELYGNMCQILPPLLKMNPCDTPNWDPKRFKFGEPVGDMKYVSKFLEFRNQEMDKLFEKFRSK